ncbi:chemotaxis protein CheD [Shewanella dokdonensis]|uniref:Probable chemoreceptor glutamine deamidase CheD n=1 Tax=Shewanella dokdonensis TaxID=712036 RepID=A0ABX8DKA5_9GAMM|nr:chemotaxis protein CheD [Shewanella dokdonensis]MCL1075913.1 chemotaxis protein CheD [Shewanella dokdonensis]QVK24232.1 chemotaxis protein CheD [Shewanella dokdonensis]
MTIALSLPQTRKFVLNPGELLFSQEPVQVQTLLGSCVAITLWHPQHKLGGMCHYLLPDRQRFHRPERHPHGYFGSDVFHSFLEHIAKARLSPSEFEAKIFGGGNVILWPDRHRFNINVAEANIRFGQQRLREAGFAVKAEDVGGERYRQVVFEMNSGSVWVKYGRCG